MTTPSEYVSRYDQRVNLIKNTLKQHSKLGEKASFELAEHILHTLDHMPEKVR